MIGFLIYMPTCHCCIVILFDADDKEIQSSDGHLSRGIREDENHNPINE